MIDTFVKDIIIRTEIGNQPLKHEAQIIFTLSPAEHLDLHFEALVWKIVTFNPNQDSEVRIRWHSSFGFMWPELNDGNSVLASTSVALDPAHSVVLSGGKHAGCSWSRPSKLTGDAKTGRYAAVNKCGSPETIIFGTVSSKGPLVVEPAILFHDVPGSQTVEINQTIILQAYFVNSRPRNAPAKVWLLRDVENKGSPLFPEPGLNVHGLENQTRYFLYTNPGSEAAEFKEDTFRAEGRYSMPPTPGPDAQITSKMTIHSPRSTARESWQVL